MTPGKQSTIIRIKNMSFYAYHGITVAEKEKGCRFEIDCEYKTDISKAVRNDSVEHTVDYSRIYESIKNIITNNKFNLIETLAEKIADEIYDSFNLDSLKIKVRKLNPPVTGEVDFFEVEVERNIGN